MDRLLPGDIFCSRNTDALGGAIKLVQKFNSIDNAVDYSHSGIICGPSGKTYEAVKTVRHQNLFSAYNGQKVLIGRHRGMSHFGYLRGMSEVLKKYRGNKGNR